MALWDVQALGSKPSEASPTAPLDHALAEWIQLAVPRWPRERRVALMSRIGWGGAACPTLEEVGQECGITRERVRQLQRKLVERLRRCCVPDSEALVKSCELIRECRNPQEAAGFLLCRAGLTSAALPAAGVALLLDLLGASAEFSQYQSRLATRTPAIEDALRRAKGLTHSVGVVSLDWVCESAEISLDRSSIRTLLDRSLWARFLDQDWFWNPNTGPKRNRLVNLTRKMLSACGPLKVAEVRDGLDRQFRLHRLPHIPPAQALRMFYRQHPGFSVDSDDVVSSQTVLGPEDVLDVTEMIFYDILQAAPDGVLDRGELFAQAVAAGMNPNTFSVYTTYSPILDNPAQDRWVLRGNDVSPAALEVKRGERKQRLSTDEWTERGTLLLTRELGNGWSLVVGVPRPLGPYLAGRSFAAQDESGTAAGTIRFDPKGLSWGYSRLLQAAGTCKGDVLRAEFDLTASTVRLSLDRQVVGGLVRSDEHEVA
jgi:hypothetical protein